jgi:hypothetical protein
MPTDPWGVSGVDDAPSGTSAPPNGAKADDWGVASVEDTQAPTAKATTPAPTIKASSPTVVDYVRRFLFGGPNGETALGRAFPSLSGAKIGDQPASDLPPVRFEELIPAGEAGPSVTGMYGVPMPKSVPPTGLARGGAQVLTSLTKPANAEMLAATDGIGALAPEIGYSSVAAKTAHAAIGAYFTYEMGKGATEAMKAAKAAHDAGNDDEAARLLGFGSVEGLLAAAGAVHAGVNVKGILDTKIPKAPLEPEVVEPEPQPEPEPIAAPPKPTVDVKPGAGDEWGVQKVEEATTAGSSFKPRVGKPSDYPKVGALSDIPAQQPEPPAQTPPNTQLLPEAETGNTSAENPEEAAKPAAATGNKNEPSSSSRPEGGDLATEAEKNSGDEWAVAKVETPAPSIQRGDVLAYKKDPTIQVKISRVQDGKLYGSSNEPGDIRDVYVGKVEDFEPLPSVQSNQDERSEPGPGSREAGISGTGAPAARPGAGETTSVVVPGEETEIGARYEVRDLSEIQPSHSGHTFLANPDYAHHNERDYSKPENQQRIINQSSEEKFNPRYLVTDNPDALNGPPVIDEDGHVLGGNSRAMTLQRVYGRNAQAAASYRELLERKAAQFGIDPASLADLENPVLVRVASDDDLHALPGGSKWAIRKTNVSGTAQLSASERATADAGQMTPEMKADIAQAIEEAGPGATLSDALTGRAGTILVNRLIAQGFFSEQERPSLMDGRTGALTQLAKDRISKALLGQFFQDSDQFQRFPASIKQKLERVSAPLATVAGEPGWDLLPKVKEAVNLIEYADAHGIKNLSDVVAQRDFFGGESSPWTPEAIRLAELLRNAKPNDVVAAFRKYVNSKEPTMFGESTPQEAFRDAFEGSGGGMLADLGQDGYPEGTELRFSQKNGETLDGILVGATKDPITGARFLKVRAGAKTVLLGPDDTIHKAIPPDRFAPYAPGWAGRLPVSEIQERDTRGANISGKRVAELANAYLRKDAALLSKPIVFIPDVGGKLSVAEGFHRAAAAKLTGVNPPAVVANASEIAGKSAPEIDRAAEERYRLGDGLLAEPLFARKLKGEDYDPQKTYSGDDLVAQFDWDIYPPNNRRPLRMRLNWQTAQVLGKAFRVPFHGLTLDARAAATGAERLRRLANLQEQAGRISPQSAEAMEDLADLLDLLAQTGQPMYLYRERTPESETAGARMRAIRQSAATQREELIHAQQFRYAKGNLPGGHLGNYQAKVTGHQYFPSIRREIERQGYTQPRWTLEHQILEAAAKGMAGKLLNIPDRVMNSWLEQYYYALHQAHGPEAAEEVFRFADRRFQIKPEWRENGSHLRSQRERDQHRVHGGDGDSGPAQRLGRGDANGSADRFDEADQQQPGLFGESARDEVARSAERDRNQLEGDRLTAQFHSPLTREEQLKKLKRSKENSQSNFFEDTAPSQGALFDKEHAGERGSIKADLLTLGLSKFLTDDVAPGARTVAAALAAAKDDLLKLAAPAARGVPAGMASLSVREHAAELQRSTDRAEAALRIASKYFDAQEPQANYEFIDRMEQGLKQPTPELDQFAAVMREILDTRRAKIQALGKGKLARFIENYFPHIWKKPEQAAAAYANWAKRPLEGSKAFLKQRTIDSFAVGLQHGLEPVSDNPVDLVLAKAREMDKYLAAHRILNDLKELGLLKFVDARDGQAPYGWQKIDDPAATVYGPSIQHITEYPNAGLWSGLEKVAQALGIRHERGFLNLRGEAVGRARRGGGIQTLHGTAEDVVAHEIGHQIDWLAGSGKRFVLEYPDKQTVERIQKARRTLKDTKGTTLDQRREARKELESLQTAIQQRKQFAKELRDLADLRSGPASYTRKREEKMAQLAEMWVGARELFERTAPTVFREWKKFLDENPKLHALRDIEGTTEVLPMAQPYDVGGLVIKGHWWAPEQAATIVNHYLSPGLRDKSGLYRGILSLGNLINQAQLGFSAFHLGFTTFDVATSKLALGIYQIGHGDILKGLASAAKTPLAPFTNVMRGDRMLKEWYNPGTQGALIGELVDAMMKAGGRAQMDAFYQTQITKKFLKALRAFNLPGALLRLPGTVLEQTARPIMEWVVPRQKMGVFADLAQYELEKLGTDASDPDLQAALARAWDSVDNRLGQLVYDNLFWHKVIKDLALISVRSVGWNVGTIRELAGGLGDIPKTATGQSDFTPRSSYVIALPIVAGLIGAIAYYLWHGHAPKHLKDYYAVPDSRGHRWMFPTYMKDAIAYAHDPAATVRGKIHPLATLLWEMLANKDFFDHPIRNPHHPLVKQAEELASYVLKQIEPIAYRDDRKHHHADAREKALGFFGVKPAPKYLK